MSFCDTRGVQLDPAEVQGRPVPLRELLADGITLANIQRAVLQDGRLTVDQRVELVGVLIDMHDAIVAPEVGQ